eukprot:35823-Pyramimonas_sp.AAC.1
MSSVPELGYTSRKESTVKPWLGSQADGLACDVSRAQGESSGREWGTGHSVRNNKGEGSRRGRLHDDAQHANQRGGPDRAHEPAGGPSRAHLGGARAAAGGGTVLGPVTAAGGALVEAVHAPLSPRRRAIRASHRQPPAGAGPLAAGARRAAEP